MSWHKTLCPSHFFKDFQMQILLQDICKFGVWEVLASIFSFRAGCLQFKLQGLRVGMLSVNHSTVYFFTEWYYCVIMSKGDSGGPLLFLDAPMGDLSNGNSSLDYVIALSHLGQSHVDRKVVLACTPVWAASFHGSQVSWRINQVNQMEMKKETLMMALEAKGRAFSVSHREVQNQMLMVLLTAWWRRYVIAYTQHYDSSQILWYSAHHQDFIIRSCVTVNMCFFPFELVWTQDICATAGRQYVSDIVSFEVIAKGVVICIL